MEVFDNFFKLRKVEQIFFRPSFPVKHPSVKESRELNREESERERREWGRERMMQRERKKGFSEIGFDELVACLRSSFRKHLDYSGSSRLLSTANIGQALFFFTVTALEFFASELAMLVAKVPFYETLEQEGPWCWSSSQHPCVLLRRSEIESSWLMNFSVLYLEKIKNI